MHTVFSSKNRVVSVLCGGKTKLKHKAPSQLKTPSTKAEKETGFITEHTLTRMWPVWYRMQWERRRGASPSAPPRPYMRVGEADNNSSSSQEDGRTMSHTIHHQHSWGDRPYELLTSSKGRINFWHLWEGGPSCNLQWGTHKVSLYLPLHQGSWEHSPPHDWVMGQLLGPRERPHRSYWGHPGLNAGQRLI